MQLQREYTDKFVVADASRPELTRFRGLTGVVKTVNMSGRALVEFDGRAFSFGGTVVYRQDAARSVAIINGRP